MNKNNQYDPTGATDCTLETLLALGDSVGSCAVETSDINGLYMDEVNPAQTDEPLNKIATYTAWGDNESAITTWVAAVDNATTGKVKKLFGSGEKPEPEQNEATLYGGSKVVLGIPNHPFVFNIDRIDQTTFQFLRKLQKYKGKYHFWYETPEYFYGGDLGMQGDVVKVVFTYAAGGTEAVKAAITINWKAYAEPIRDPRTY